MMKQAVVAVGVVLGLASVAAAQSTDSPFQVQVVAKLKKKDVIRATNTGASSTVAIPQNGALCANVYAFSTAGPLIGCCACRLAPNSFASIPIVADVLGSPKPIPKDVVLKVMASSGNQGACEPGAVGTGGNVFVTGFVGWKNETQFAPATLSAAELSSLNTQCSILHPTPSICASCAVPTP